MRFNLLQGVFITIGIAIGIILALQIRANPVQIGSFPTDQLALQQELLDAFSKEQDLLKNELDILQEQRLEADRIIEQRTSRNMIELLVRLREKSAFDKRKGPGIRISLSDNTSVNRLDFSSINNNFVQAADLRDVINGLYIQGAEAISINGIRIGPLTPIQAAFDTILVGNYQIASPYIVEALGNQKILVGALDNLNKKSIRIFVEPLEEISMTPITVREEFHYLTKQ